MEQELQELRNTIEELNTELHELRMYSYKCTDALQKVVFLFEKVNNDDLYESDVEVLKDFINANL